MLRFGSVWPVARIAVTNGTVDAPGFLTVSHIGLADVLAEPGFLPFRSGVADELAMIDVLDLFPRRDGTGLIREARRTLRNGGALTVVVPDAKKSARTILRNGFSAWEQGETARRRGLVPASLWDFPSAGAALDALGMSVQRVRRHRWGRRALVVVAIAE